MVSATQGADGGCHKGVCGHHAVQKTRHEARVVRRQSDLITFGAKEPNVAAQANFGGSVGGSLCEHYIQDC